MDNITTAFQKKNYTKSLDVTDSTNNVDFNTNPEMNEELLKLVAALEDAKKMYMNEKERVTELEDELKCISNENRTLQTRLHVNANDEMKSIHEELSILEEVRYVLRLTTMCGSVTLTRNLLVIFLDKDKRAVVVYAMQMMYKCCNPKMYP
jgi:hypothetical protein